MFLQQEATGVDGTLLFFSWPKEGGRDALLSFQVLFQVGIVGYSGFELRLAFVH